MNKRPFITRTIMSIDDYTLPENAPPLISDQASEVCRHNLFESPAPEHTRNYMLGLDVLSWTNENGVARSQLIVDQKAGSMVLPWEPRQGGGGIWIYLQETYRAPHPKNTSSVRQLIERGEFAQLGVWSLEAPAGGLNYEDSQPRESPIDAAIREVKEETGILASADSLEELIPGGLQIGVDINTKRSYLFAANISTSDHEASSKSIEADEQVGNLIAFCVSSISDIKKLTTLTRLDANTTASLALFALLPGVQQLLRLR